VPKADWGTKRLCQSCGARFYDLKRDPIVCPKCAAVYVPEAETRGKKRPSPAEKKKKAVPPPEAVVAEEEVLVAEGEEEEGEEVLEDASELGEDEDYEEVAESVEKEEP